MATIQKVSEKLTVHINRTGFYALISVFIVPFLVYPLLKINNLRQKESKFQCTQLDSQQINCGNKKNGLEENKAYLKQVEWASVTEQVTGDKPEIDKPSDFNYQVAIYSKNQEFDFSNLKGIQAGIEEVGRNINFLLTDSKQSNSQTTQTDYLSHEVNSSKLKVVIFYAFFIFLICSILESKPFYEKLIFDRKSQELTVLKFMIFWFKKNKYSLRNNFDLYIESETDDYDTTIHKLNLVLKSEEKIILYQGFNYNEVEKLLKEIREFLNLGCVKVKKIKV